MKNAKSKAIEHMVYGPRTAANNTDTYRAEVRRGGFAVDHKNFKTEKEAHNWGKSHKGSVSSGVKKQYSNMFKRYNEK